MCTWSEDSLSQDINNMVVSLITRSQLHSRLNIFNENVSHWFLHIQTVQSGNQTKEYSLYIRQNDHGSDTLRFYQSLLVYSQLSYFKNQS